MAHSSYRHGCATPHPGYGPKTNAAPLRKLKRSLSWLLLSTHLPTSPFSVLSCSLPQGADPRDNPPYSLVAASGGARPWEAGQRVWGGLAGHWLCTPPTLSLQLYSLLGTSADRTQQHALAIAGDLRPRATLDLRPPLQEVPSLRSFTWTN